MCIVIYIVPYKQQNLPIPQIYGLALKRRYSGFIVNCEIMGNKASIEYTVLSMVALGGLF